MGRKNGNSASKKRRSDRRDQLSKSRRIDGLPAAKPRGPRRPVPLVAMVLPTGVCRTGKMRFPDERTAARALRQARQNREAMHSGRVEKRYYRCPHCEGFHLTSRDYREREA